MPSYDILYGNDDEDDDFEPAPPTITEAMWWSRFHGYGFYPHREWHNMHDGASSMFHVEVTHA
jgi:hypothetical protein